MNNSKEDKILQFIFEAGLLKRIPRSGWHVLGVPQPESIADHSFRCAVIAYCIARMEKADTASAILMALFNDIHEARIGDLHKMSQRYFDYEKAETNAFLEQIESLPDPIRSDLKTSQKDYREQITKASVIARDADILECLIQAKEYESTGINQAKKFMKKGPQFLKTKSARHLWKLCQKSDPNHWWEKLSGFQR